MEMQFHHSNVGAMLVTFALVFTVSCSARRALRSFRVLQASPDYLLRSPDSNNTPFPEVLGRHTKIDSGWVELCPETELRIENAYFRAGTTKRVFANFLGTGIARYQVRSNGRLRLISVTSGVTQPPGDQPPVQRLIRASRTRYRHHRFFFQIWFKNKAETRNAVLLSARSKVELDRITSQLLTEPAAICGDAESIHCTVFPESCTVSLEIEIVVNGAHRTVLWGSVLASVADRPRHVELLRRYAGKLTPVEIDSGDSNALRLPLLPGDRLNWH